MKAYLCARYDRRLEMKEYAAQLEARGIQVPARWIKQGNDGWPKSEAAIMDMEDLIPILLDGGMVIGFLESAGTYTSGGRHVEFGAALLANIIFPSLEGVGVPKLVLIGEPENIFHHYGTVQLYPTWEDFLATVEVPTCV